MALTRLNNNAIGETITAAKGGTGVTSADEIGNIVLIKKQVISASVASVEFKNGTNGVVFDNTYDIYQMYCHDMITASDNQKIDIDVSFDTGANYKTASYRSSAFRSYHGASGNGSNNNTRTGDIQTLNINTKSTTAGGTINGLVTFYNPSNSSKNPIIKFEFVGYDGDYQINNFGGSAHETDGDIDAFRIIGNGANLTGGTFTLYGVRT
jgi:hypothetical protein